MHSFNIIILIIIRALSRFSLDLAAGDCWFIIITNTKIYSTHLFHEGVDSPLAWVTRSALPLQTTNKGIQSQPRSISYNTMSCFKHHIMRFLSSLWPHRSFDQIILLACGYSFINQSIYLRDSINPPTHASFHPRFLSVWKGTIEADSEKKWPSWYWTRWSGKFDMAPSESDADFVAIVSDGPTGRQDCSDSNQFWRSVQSRRVSSRLCLNRCFLQK